jgi:hypothetical protein
VLDAIRLCWTHPRSREKPAACVPGDGAWICRCCPAPLRSRVALRLSRAAACRTRRALCSRRGRVLDSRSCLSQSPCLSLHSRGSACNSRCSEFQSRFLRSRSRCCLAKLSRAPPHLRRCPPESCGSLSMSSCSTFNPHSASQRSSCRTFRSPRGALESLRPLPRSPCSAPRPADRPSRSRGASLQSRCHRSQSLGAWFVAIGRRFARLRACCVSVGGLGESFPSAARPSRSPLTLVAAWKGRNRRVDASLPWWRPGTGWDFGIAFCPSPVRPSTLLTRETEKRGTGSFCLSNRKTLPVPPISILVR